MGEDYEEEKFFGDLDLMMAELKPSGWRNFTLAQVANIEWKPIEKVLRKIFPEAQLALEGRM